MSKPIVLMGQTGKRTFVEELRRRRWGRICWRDRPVPYPGEPWALDNGAYRNWLAGGVFDGDVYLRTVDRAISAETRDTPIYFAVAPDIVAGGMESLDFSLRWLDHLPPTWPVYLAVQDGMGMPDVGRHLRKFSGIFLGGSNSFKATARRWLTLAHSHGLPFHYGRAGTPQKLLHAIRIGADSLDSAFPLWTQKRWEWFLYLYDNGHPQRDLFREPVK